MGRRSGKKSKYAKLRAKANKAVAKAAKRATKRIRRVTRKTEKVLASNTLARAGRRAAKRTRKAAIRASKRAAKRTRRAVKQARKARKAAKQFVTRTKRALRDRRRQQKKAATQARREQRAREREFNRLTLSGDADISGAMTGGFLEGSGSSKPGEPPKMRTGKGRKSITAELRMKGKKPQARTYVDKKAHLILPTHRVLDKVSELDKGDKKIGSTLKGIGPTYMDKTGRNGIRMGDIFNSLKDKYEALKEKHLLIMERHKMTIEWLDLYTQIEKEEKDWFTAIEFLKSVEIIDSEYFINKSLKERKTVLAEGAQGSLLDVDYGTYPFVTSSNTTISGVISGLGVAPHI